MGDTFAGFEKTAKRKPGWSRSVWMGFLHFRMISPRPGGRENSQRLSKTAGGEKVNVVSSVIWELSTSPWIIERKKLPDTLLLFFTEVEPVH